MDTDAETKRCTGGQFDVVLLAASAGGIPAIGTVLGGLPADFPAAALVVQHLDPRYKSYLSQILDRRTELEVREATEGVRLVAGLVYLAPTDHHLLVNADCTLSLSQSELVHFVRPSADLLFKSAAAALGQRAIAVVMTGTGHDGEAGVRAIKAGGGVVVVQDEKSAQFYSMPHYAIATGCADYVVPLDEIPGLLIRLVREGIGDVGD
jgi:two-component system chemotaxis response regulator CheB